MSNSANMVVVENGEWTLHDAHWVGGRMLDVVAFGPEHAVRYIRAHDESESGWTDPASADGGVIVDLDRHRMLVFGEELAVTMNERRHARCSPAHVARLRGRMGIRGDR